MVSRGMLGQSTTEMQSSGATTKNSGTAEGAEGAEGAEEIEQKSKAQPSPQVTADEIG